MFSEKERKVVNAIGEGKTTAKEISDFTGLNYRTVYDALKELENQDFVEQSGKKKEKTKPSKQYRLKDRISVSGILDSKTYEREIQPRHEKEPLLKIWKIPQEEFHAALLEYIQDRYESRAVPAPKAAAVYGSVARGEADEYSDIDLLLVIEDTGKEIEEMNLRVNPRFGEEKVVSEHFITEKQLREGLKSGSDFLQNVLSQMIIIYDKENILRDVQKEEAGPGIPG